MIPDDLYSEHRVVEFMAHMMTLKRPAGTTGRRSTHFGGLWQFVVVVAVAFCSGRYMVSAGLNNQASRTILRDLRHGDLGVLNGCRRVAPHGTITIVEHALAWNPNNTQARVNLGRAFWLQGNCEQALAAWESASVLVSHDSTVWFWLGMGYHTVGNTAGAVHAFQQVPACGYLLARAEEAKSQRAYGEALGWLDLCGNSLTKVKEAEELVAAYADLGWDDKMVETWQRLANLKPLSDPEHWWALGEALRLQKDWSKAFEAYQEGSARTGDPFRFYERQGQVLMSSGDLTGAIWMYQRLLALKPDLLDLYLAIGSIEKKRGDFGAAVGWYQQARHIQPQSAYPDLYWGILATESGDFDQAVLHLQAALKIEPRNAEVYYRLGELAHKQRNVSKAIQYIEKAIDLQSGRAANWWIVLSDLYVEVGRWEDARKAYQEALAQQQLQDLPNTIPSVP